MTYKHIFLLAILLIVGERLYHRFSGGVTFQKIYCTCTFQNGATLLSEEEKSQINKILNQRFYFLAKGVQSYAFLSEDKQTVLKLFKHYHMWPPTNYLHYCSFVPGVNHLITRRKKRMRHILKSLRIANEQLREETGAFYLHQPSNQDLHPMVTAYDKFKIAHSLNLNGMEFVLQKYAEPALPHLERLFSQHRFKEAKESLKALFQLIGSRCKKAIKNKDSKIEKNYGFSEEKALEIDIGSYAYRQDKGKKYREKEELKMAKHLKTFLGPKFPESISLIDSCISHEKKED